MTGSPSPPFGQRPAVRTVKAFYCPNCGGAIQLKAVGISINAVCRQCSTVIDAANPDLAVIRKGKAVAFESDLEIGARGELYGVTWEIIGCVRKGVQGGYASWDEYLLFNPWQGFRFLSNVDGHWTFFKRYNGSLPGIGHYNALKMNGRSYVAFNKDRVSVTALKGEFYWRVKTGDVTQAADYISPPFMLSSETSGDEINISLGVYLPKADLQKAFPEATLPYASGVGACQIPPFHGKIKKVLGLGIAAGIAAIVVHIAAAMVSPSQVMVDIHGTPIVVKPVAPGSEATATATATATWDTPGEILDKPQQTTGETLQSLPFVLPRDGNIRIDLSTGLDNGWADFGLTLVNDKTGVDFPLQKSTSYYHGYEGGESWSEGSNRTEAFLSNVPAGTYRLLIDADSDELAKNGQLPFSLTLRRGVSEIWNLWIALGLIALYPAFVFFRRWQFESSRYANSDYAPNLLQDD